MLAQSVRPNSNRPPGVGEDRDVRPGDAKQGPEQQPVLDALPPRDEMASGEGGMRHEHQVVIARERPGRAQPRDEGAGEHAREPEPRHVLEPAGERGQGAGDVGKVQAAPAGALVRIVHRVGASLYAVLERFEPVDEVLIVLDDVAAAAREGARHLHQPGDRDAPRLEGGSEQRAAVHAGERPHAGHPVTRAVEGREHAVGEGEVHQPHAGHHGDVAEHEVDERRHAARLHHRGVVAQDRSRGARRGAVDPLDCADDAGGQAGGVRQRLRHLHRLLQGDRGGEALRGAAGVVELVGGDDAVAGGSGRLGHGMLDARRGYHGTPEGGDGVRAGRGMECPIPGGDAKWQASAVSGRT